jgi:hypothetical protein
LKSPTVSASMIVELDNLKAGRESGSFAKEKAAA